MDGLIHPNRIMHSDESCGWAQQAILVNDSITLFFWASTNKVAIDHREIIQRSCKEAIRNRLWQATAEREFWRSGGSEAPAKLQVTACLNGV